jgi:hypothetical protein
VQTALRVEGVGEAEQIVLVPRRAVVEDQQAQRSRRPPAARDGRERSMSAATCASLAVVLGSDDPR